MNLIRNYYIYSLSEKWEGYKNGEVYQDKKSDKLISLTEYNKNFSAEKSNQLYSRRMCIVDGKVGEVCAKSDYSTCNSNLFQCITK